MSLKKLNRKREIGLNLKTILYLGSTFLAVALAFVLSQIVLAGNNPGNFQIKNSYIEIQQTDYPQNISLVKKENGKEEITGQVKIVDQYLISDLPENEFLDEYSYLKSGFQDLSISLETDEPLFDKENFYYSPSLFDKTKSLFGFESLPEYRITKEVDKTHSVRTELDLKKLRIETHYQELGIENNELRIKQTLAFTNESKQDLNLALLLRNQVEANKIYWNNQEYSLTKTPRKFVNPDKIAFYTPNEEYLSFYDFSDVPEEFKPELWAENKDGQNLLILSLNVSLSAGETKTIDPTYGVEITILNVHSHPQAGDYWTVSFETTGTADLTITPEDQATIDDLDFVSLKCGGEERTPQILEGDVIFYPNWSCNKTGEETHLVNIAGWHTLKFQFGEQIAYAYNAPDNGDLHDWIWSDNIGWISLNCEEGGPSGGNICTTSSYKVNIDPSTNELSGYAWSDNVGWLSFNRAGTGGTGTPPGPPYNGSETYIAKRDSSTERIKGWARFLANGGGWDGWVSLNCEDTTDNCITSNYNVRTEGSDIKGYAWGSNVVDWIQFNPTYGGATWESNTAPTVDSVSISPSPIDLNPNNATETVTITATITDNDGCEDVFVNGSITGVFYDAAEEGDSCTQDDNDCYTSLTLTEVDGTCTGAGDYEADASVDVEVWFIANPSSQWTAKVTATDEASESGSKTQTVTINTLRALDVTGGPINYGTLNPGGNTESINQEVTVYNVGNIACDVRLYGTDITWSGNNIDASYQEYSLSGFTYGAGNDLKEDPAYDDIDADLPKPTSHSPSNSSDIFYWGLGVPSPMPASDQYSGTNTFEVIDAL